MKNIYLKTKLFLFKNHKIIWLIFIVLLSLSFSRLARAQLGEVDPGVPQAGAPVDLNTGLQPSQTSQPTSQTTSQGTSGLEQVLILYLSKIIFAFVYALGRLLTYVIGWLMQVASWNNFIDVAPVITGWVIVRDLCNMFFILILLVIAFATILRVESYPWKKLLPKLLIMAVLINFSRTIAGLIIDFSQVIMVTFVNGFSGGGAGNLTTMLGMDKMMSLITEKYNTATLEWTTFAGVTVALIASIISFIVILVLLVILIMRVIMLWIYVILSPIAFFAAAFPSGQKYSGQWWAEFTKQLITGPILAFFIWLALTTVQKVDLGTASVSAAFGDGIISGFLQNNVFQTYIITVGLLMGGLIVTQQAGGAAGSIAGKGMAAIQKGRAWTTGKIKRKAGELSGVSAVGNYFKLRAVEKEKKRTARIEAQTSRIAQGIGYAKQYTVGEKALGRVGNWAYSKTPMGKLKKQAEDTEKEISELQGDKTDLVNNVKDKKSFSYAGGLYDYDEKSKNWQELGSGTTLDESTLRAQVELNFDRKINPKKASLQKLKDRRAKMDKILRGGWAATGVGLGLLSGGIGWGGLIQGGAGGYLGGFGLKRMKDAAKNSGKFDFGIRSDYVNKMESENQEKLKFESNETVLQQMNDPSKSVFARTAASIEAMSRKLLDLETVRIKRDDINRQMGGDKRLMSKIEAILEKNYVGMTSIFRDLKGTDPTKQADAARKIRSMYESGAYNLKDMDGDSIKDSIKQMVDGLKTSKFNSQFDSLDSSKQSAIINALKGERTYEAREKLAHVTSINEAFITKPDREKFVKGLTVDQIMNIIKKGSEKQNADLKLVVSKDPTKLHDEVQRIIKSKSSQGNEINESLLA